MTDSIIRRRAAAGRRASPSHTGSRTPRRSRWRASGRGCRRGIPASGRTSARNDANTVRQCHEDGGTGAALREHQRPLGRVAVHLVERVVHACGSCSEASSVVLPACRRNRRPQVARERDPGVKRAVSTPEKPQHVVRRPAAVLHETAAVSSTSAGSRRRRRRAVRHGSRDLLRQRRSVTRSSASRERIQSPVQASTARFF